MKCELWSYSFKDCLQEIKTHNLTWVCAMTCHVGMAPPDTQKYIYIITCI